MVRVKHSMAAYAAIRQDPALIGLMQSEGSRLAARATSLARSRRAKYEASAASVTRGRAPRARITVKAANAAAMADNARHNTLLQALGGG